MCSLPYDGTPTTNNKNSQPLISDQGYKNPQERDFDVTYIS